MSIHVYLVPGFFGFTSLGGINYFHRVAQVLDAALRRRGIQAHVVECRTQPTGSLRRRAEGLLEQVVGTGGATGGEVHFVAHSAGGLDVRVLLSPSMRLSLNEAREDVGRRARTAVLIATPNTGTPLAAAFESVQGRQLLQVLALLATTGPGRRAVYLAALGLGMAARMDDALGRRATFLDNLSEKLLRRVTVSGADPVWEFLRQVAVDQGVIVQLQPESMNLLDAALPDRPGVAYSSVVAAAPDPPFSYRLRDLSSPEAVALAALFTVVHRLTAREHRAYPYPRSEPVLRELRHWLGFEVTGKTSDGIVPTLSQVHGRILDVVRADHLDVVGQFRDAGGDAHADWLPSASRFDESRFLGLWDRIAAEIERNSKG